ncbi:hypothetical protein IJ732_08210 [bacterium]|nr:hypothetical protein [bacterium]
MANKVHIPNIGIAEVSEYIPTKQEEILISEFETQAESDIAKKLQKKNIHFRWSEFEITRAKKIAAQLGLPYQTYIKSLLKQGMDKDEKKLRQM